MPRALMIDDDWEERVTFADDVTVDWLIRVLMVLVITLAEAAAPPAALPPPAAPSARASITDESMAEMATSPVAVMVEPLVILAPMVLLMILTEIAAPTATLPPPAPAMVRLTIWEVPKSGMMIPEVPVEILDGEAAVVGGAMPAITETFPVEEVTEEWSILARMMFSS